MRQPIRSAYNPFLGPVDDEGDGPGMVAHLPKPPGIDDRVGRLFMAAAVVGVWGTVVALAIYWLATGGS